MKYIKYIAMMVILAAIFLIESNDYSTYLPEGITSRYPVISFDYSNDEERIQIWNEIINYSEKNKIDIIACNYKRVNAIDGVIEFFGKEEVLSELFKEYDIKPGYYKSFSDGKTAELFKVTFRMFF